MSVKSKMEALLEGKKEDQSKVVADLAELSGRFEKMKGHGLNKEATSAIDTALTNAETQLGKGKIKNAMNWLKITREEMIKWGGKKGEVQEARGDVTAYQNKADGVTGKVSRRKDGQLAVVLMDDDSGEVVSPVQIFPMSREKDAHALAKKWANLREMTEAHCSGKLANGPGKKYAVCGKCGKKDYEGNEGDKCGAELDDPKMAKQGKVKMKESDEDFYIPVRDFIDEMIDEEMDPEYFRQKLHAALTKRTLRRESEEAPEPEGKIDPVAYNNTLSKLLQKLKKDLGATAITQNYKGTGAKKHRKQVFVRCPWGSIDIWLEHNRAKLGGVILPLGNPGPQIAYEGKEPAGVYHDILLLLKDWKESKTAEMERAKPKQEAKDDYTKPFYGWSKEQKKAFARSIEVQGEVVKVTLGSGGDYETYFSKNGEVERRTMPATARGEATYYDVKGNFLRRGR